MKEAYFTPDSIRTLSLRMRDDLELPRQRHAHQRLELQRAALLVLDMQEYFLRADSHAFVPSGVAIVPNLQRLIRAFRGAGRPVVFTQHLNSPADARQMQHWWKDLIVENSALSELTAELDTAAGIVLRKSQYDAFLDSTLDETLRASDIGQLVITGLLTHLCCETTARAAFTRGYEVFFVIDGSATYNQAFHTATLLNLTHGFAVPLLSDEVLEAFGD